jgi:hypothetical protein
MSAVDAQKKKCALETEFGPFGKGPHPDDWITHAAA